MVHGAALEKRSSRKRSVGSNPTLSATTVNLWRGAGVDYQARLESECSLWLPWVRIPPSPPACADLLAEQVLWQARATAGKPD